MPRPPASSSAFYRRGRSSSMRVSVPRIRSRSRSRAATKKLTNYVINKTQETKISGIEGPITSFNPDASVYGDVYRVIPTISEGDSSSSRDGREIKMMSHTIKGTVKITANNPLYCTVWMVEDKWQKDFSTVDASTAFLVYKNIANTPVNPSGDWSQYGLKLNKDRFIIRRKTFKLSTHYLPAATQANLEDSTAPLMRHFSFKRSWKNGKKLIYANDYDALPHNYNTYIFVSLQDATNSSGPLSSTEVQLQATSFITYKG